MLEATFQHWLAEHTGRPGPWQLRRLSGGNSNETYLIFDGSADYIVRRPPPHALSASAHNIAREARLFAALADTAVPLPQPIGLCEDPPCLVMEHVPDSVSLREELPETYGPDALVKVADEVIDALAAVHQVDWRAAGLTDFGRPENFLERQVGRWLKQWQSIARRPLPALEAVGRWLEDNRPQASPPALMHGDFHVDNCLFSATQPRLLAVVDWEMATIGDPLLDLGLLLAFWGERPADPGMADLQAFSRQPGGPDRDYLLARYEDAVGRRIEHVRYYRILAMFKLAAIVEAAWSQYLAGELDSDYAASLEHDVPALLAEAADLAGI